MATGLFCGRHAEKIEIALSFYMVFNVLTLGSVAP